MAEPADRHDDAHLPTRKDGRAWPAPGHWTYEDYRRLPDDGQRYEVIQGTLYVSGAPDYDHQYAVHQLHRLLGNPVAEKGLGVVLGAPFEVLLLPGGMATPVQPDILFFRTGNEPRPGAPRFEGVPDLIVEVLSPGTCRRDEGIKLETYEETGGPGMLAGGPPGPAGAGLRPHRWALHRAGPGPHRKRTPPLGKFGAVWSKHLQSPGRGDGM